MIASTWLDLVVGLDIHFEMVPTPAPVPTPFPHPFVGMVFDPAGLAMGLAISNTIGMAMGGSFKGPVLIWGMPANTTGTEAKNSFVLPHFIIPPGTMWTPMPKAPKPPFKGKTRPPDLPVAPAGDAVMIVGSKTVTTMGSNQCRLGDLAMSCAEPVRLPSSAVIAIPKGPPVLVGGPPAIDWMAAAMAFIKTKTIANELHGLVGRIKNARLRNFAHWAVCTLTGHPIDVATGRMMTRATDWSLPGPIPLEFERNYASSWSNREGPLGWGWSHSLDQAVWIERGCVVYRAGDGREIEFDTFALDDHAMRPGDTVWDAFNRLTLKNTAPFTWQVTGHDGLTHHFAPVRGGDPQVARLTRVTDRAGNEVILAYDARGNLDTARDAGGRIVRFEHDHRGRLTRVLLPHPSVEAWVTHARYEYNREGELVSVIDALEHATRFEYAGHHLMVRETDRNGFSFYFGYDGTGTDARCVRTWGDGGVYDHVLFYDPKARRSTVTDSLGNTTLYEFNEINLCVKRTDPLGHAWVTGYDGHGWKTEEIDPLGNASRWEYDERGNLVASTSADGARTMTRLDPEGRPIEHTDVLGGRWAFERSPDGTLAAAVDPLGGRTSFSERGDGVAEWVDAAGHSTWMRRGAGGSVTEMVLPGGLRVTASYDRRGARIETRASNGRNNQTRYDDLGRAVESIGPGGVRTRAVWEPEGAPRELEIEGRPTRFGYAGFRSVSTEVRDGVAVTLAHDSEGRLTSLTNARGEVRRWHLDARGDVVAIEDFSGAVTRFERDAAGSVTRVSRPDGTVTAYTRDPMDRALRIEHSDGTFLALTYAADGSVTSAQNERGTTTFERDLLGRVVAERQAHGEVRSRYGPHAERELIESSLGARVTIERDAVGTPALVHYGDARAWSRRVARFERDDAGALREVAWSTGHAVRWARDELGRPTSRVCSFVDAKGRGEATEAAYRWEGVERLAAVIDTERGPLLFTRDARGRLTSAEAHGWRSERALDAAGDTVAVDGAPIERAAGGAITTAYGGPVVHDPNGRIRAQRTHDAYAWSYQWNAHGHLVATERADGLTVRFEYDALSRRTRKTVTRRDGAHERVERDVRYVWDRSVLLHELDGDELTTWHWQPETFELAAVARGEAWDTVVCDALGTPLECRDAHGALRWSAALDLFGVARAETGDLRLPWRWPGQYRDVETGLHYSQFRYYDPTLNQYLSPDPLGVATGLSLYAYCDDPTVWIDPFGLDPFFRGTTAGYPGNPGVQLARRTPLSTNPAIATIFATEASNFGDGVVHIATGSDLSGIHLGEGNVLAHIEQEVVAHALPRRVASRAGLSLTAAQAREILADMGIRVPARIYDKAGLDQAIRDAPRMTRNQIKKFLRRAREEARACG